MDSSGLHGIYDVETYFLISPTGQYLKWNYSSGQSVLGSNGWSGDGDFTFSPHSEVIVNGSLNLSSGNHYYINNISLTYTDVGAAAVGHNHDTVYLGLHAKADTAAYADGCDNFSGWSVGQLQTWVDTNYVHK